MAANDSSSDIGLTQSEISAVRAPLAQASLLPARVYDDPTIFRLERERIFGRSWLPLCHVSQIENPGEYVSRVLLGEPVIAMRSREGDIKVMSNVCRHRNTTLLRGSGVCKARIVCPYHGWTYGLDGKLLAAPFMDQAEGFARREISLHDFRHEIWNGFLFVVLGGQAPPLAETLAALQPEIEPYHFEEMEWFELRRATVDWNWKISLENFSEAYHQPWVHPSTAEHEFPAAMARYEDTNNSYSLFRLHQAKGQAFPLFADAVEGIPDAFRRFVTVFNIYPYFHVLTDAAVPMILDFNILDAQRHEMVWSILMPKGSHARPDIADEVAKFLDFIAPIHMEDTDVCTGVSQGVKSKFTIPGRLSHMEKAVHQFHNWWLDRMLGSPISAL